MTHFRSAFSKTKHYTKGKSIATSIIIGKWQNANPLQAAILDFTHLKSIEENLIDKH